MKQSAKNKAIVEAIANTGVLQSDINEFLRGNMLEDRIKTLGRDVFYQDLIAFIESDMSNQTEVGPDLFATTIEPIENFLNSGTSVNKYTINADFITGLITIQEHK